MNPFLINPEQAAAEIHDFNERLVRGLHTLSGIDDIDVGPTPKDIVYREGKMVLYRYRPRTGTQAGVPLLIVYALVNRPYMADLQEDRSLVRGLLEKGLDVYLIDWGYPDAADSGLTLNDYINGYMGRCVDIIRDRHGLEKINLLGICQGGTFSLCYAALHREKIQNLITTVTPVDFHTRNDLLSHWVRHVDIEECVDAMGNIPGELLNWVFLMLRPFRLMGQKYMDLVDVLEDEEKTKTFLRMEKWIFDSPAQAGEAFREFIRQFYQENRLIKGQVEIADRCVDLERIDLPVLNIFARDDHIVPPEASRALAGCLGTGDYSELEFPGGHIGLYVSSRAQELLPQSIAGWLHRRTA